MPKYNKNFELSIDDLDRIEGALRAQQRDLPQEEDQREIHELLGRLHNQKTFFRPQKGAYVGG